MTGTNISIIGLGLIGGSLAKALKHNDPKQYITAYNKSEEALHLAANLNVIDKAAYSLKDAVINADIIVICTPLSSYEKIIKEIQPHLKPGAVITDVGSVKESPSQVIYESLSEEQKPLFIPGHPIAGTEKSGFSASFPELFQDKRVILTPNEHSDQDALWAVANMWKKCKAITETMHADHHDNVYAEISHLPQLVAFNFAKITGGKTKSCKDKIFRQFTRLSSSNHNMWQDIFDYNSKALSTATGRFRKNIASLNKKNILHKLSVARGEKPANLPANPDPLTGILPKIIACALVETASQPEYAGSGFRDMTAPLYTADDGLLDGFDNTYKMAKKIVGNIK